MRKHLAQHWEVAAACVLLLAAVCAIVATRPDPQHPLADVAYPHGTRCDATDAQTGPPCEAVRQMLQAANDFKPRPFCRHRYPVEQYQPCVRWVDLTDPGYTEFQTGSFNVLYALMPADGYARVLVRVRSINDDETGYVYLSMIREHNIWRVDGVECAHCTAPTPPS